MKFGTLVSLAALLGACGGTVPTTDASTSTDMLVVIDRPMTCLPVACVPPAGCFYRPAGSASDRIAPPACSCGELVCVDAGPDASDASADVSPDVCNVECARPPVGCRYEGPVTCSPPSCGRIVCTDAATDVATDTSPIVCSGGTSTFPTFDNRCTSSGDCVVAVHQSDCCGNNQALGIHRSQQAAFDAAEAVCRPMYPRCGCPTRGILADDDRWTFTRENIAATCRAGMCTTSVISP
jgi:hypothetical protein